MSDSPSTRARVVAAASALFASRGFGATSIADIAEASGLLKGNLAYYFRTKQELLDAVVEARANALWRELREAAGPDDDALTAVQRLLNHVRSTADELARQGCPVGSLATELGKSGQGPTSNAADLLLQLESYLAEALGRSLPEAQAAQAAEHLLAVLQGAAVLAQARHDPAVVHRQLDAAETWVGALLAAPAVLRQDPSRPRR